MNTAEKFPTFSRIGRFVRRVTWAITSPIGRFMRRWFKPFIFTSVSAVTVIALFIAVENYRTGKTWEKYQEDARARGEKLTLVELAPPPAPDDQNFAMTPLMKSTFLKSNDVDPGVRPPSLGDLKNNEESAQDDGAWPIGKKTDLTSWKAYLLPTDLLTAFKKLEPKMTEISAAVRLPYSRFPVEYAKEPPILVMLPQLSAMISLSKLYKLRALAELDAGQGDRALDDAITGFRLARAMDELALISALTEQAQLGISMQVVWEGLADNRWSDSQIAALQKEMQTMDLFPGFVRSLQGERAFFNGSLNWMKSQSSFERWKLYKNVMGSGDHLSMAVGLAVLPTFAINRGQIEMMDFYNQYIFGAINIAQRQIDPKTLKAGDEFFDREIKNRSAWLHPQVIFERALIPTIASVLRTYAKGETSLDEAIVACALERFKLAHGDYPTKLDELVPQFIEKLPHDVVNGEPLHYQRTPDGRFMLYSVGWDEKDDHGVSVDYNTSNWQGDWVWQYSPAKIWGRN